jgi:hypothetical protein
MWPSILARCAPSWSPAPASTRAGSPTARHRTPKREATQPQSTCVIALLTFLGAASGRYRPDAEYVMQGNRLCNNLTMLLLPLDKPS